MNAKYHAYQQIHFFLSLYDILLLPLAYYTLQIIYIGCIFMDSADVRIPILCIYPPLYQADRPICSWLIVSPGDDDVIAARASQSVHQKHLIRDFCIGFNSIR